LAEAHYPLAEGIRSLLSTLFKVVLIVGDETSLIAIVEGLGPDLVILDLNIMETDFRSLIQKLHFHSPSPKILVLCGPEMESTIQALTEVGADGFVAKARIASALLPTVEALLHR